MSADVYQRTARGDPLVGIEEARIHLRLETPADDAVVERMLLAAHDLVEIHAARDVRSHTWRLLRDGFTTRIPLAKHPVNQVTEVARLVSGSFVAVDPAIYYLKQLPQGAEILLVDGASWPDDADSREQNVRVDFTTSVDNLYSARARLAVLHLTAHLYENRGDVDLSDPDLIGRSGAARILDGMTIPRV